MIRKPLPLIFYILFSISILAACAKPTEIVTLPPPTATQVPATKTPSSHGHSSNANADPGAITNCILHKRATDDRACLGCR